MDALKDFLKYPQIPLTLGVILIITSFLEVMDVTILLVKIKMSFGILILGLYHIIKSISTITDSE
ncbi:MAG: hypothetical protein AABZ74_02485 [Cyanobacteriota bacterium]